MSDAPPLTPADLDLRSLSYMPLHVERLLISETWLIATGDEAKAAMTLWCRAWHQVPAASLPNDERLLAALSGAGTKWKRVRDVALRGYVLCSDGRLYHSLLASEALEALEKRERWRKKKKGQRERQAEGQNEDVPGDTQVDNDGDIPEDTRGETPLRDGTGRDNEIDRPSVGSARGSKTILAEDWQPNAEARASVLSAGYGDVEIDWQRMRFAKHFKGKSGDDWDGRFVDWVTREPVGKYAKREVRNGPSSPSNHSTDPWEARVRSYRTDLDAGKERPFWQSQMWGAAPGQRGCHAPPSILERYGFHKVAA